MHRYHSGVLAPRLTKPELAMPICEDLSYRKRQSSERQAKTWNDILEGDPEFGPETGFRVGVAPMASVYEDGPRWDLIWVQV